MRLKCWPIYLKVATVIKSFVYVIWGVGYKANFLRSVIFPIFQHDQNTGYLYDITFVFDGVRFRIWMLITARRLETLQGLKKKGVETTKLYILPNFDEK